MAHSAIYNFDAYQSRNPKASAYYKCVENHFEALEQVYPKGLNLSIFPNCFMTIQSLKFRLVTIGVDIF